MYSISFVTVPCPDSKANVRPHWQNFPCSAENSVRPLWWGKRLQHQLFSNLYPFHFCSYFQVVVLDLEVLAEISSSKTGRPIEASSSPTSSNSSTSPHFKQFMLSLLKLFSADRSLLEAKGSFIIRQLCVLLSSEDIYRSISELLVLEDNLKFARLMVETLSTILLTSSELFELRTKLKVIYKLKNSFCALRTMTGFRWYISFPSLPGAGKQRKLSSLLLPLPDLVPQSGELAKATSLWVSLGQVLRNNLSGGDPCLVPSLWLLWACWRFSQTHWRAGMQCIHYTLSHTLISV